MAKYTNEELLEAFGEMTLVELSEFVKAFEEMFDVVLTAVGDKKIQVIKAVKAITNAGLADAKAMVDGAPKAILEKAKKEDAEKAKAQLEEAGATVELK